MARKRRSPKVKIRSQRKVNEIKRVYESNVSKKKEYRSGTLDKLYEDLSKYQTKKGDPAKSKLRSNKARIEYNRILDEIAALGSAPKRKALAIEGTSNKLAKAFNLTGAGAQTAASVFVNNTLPVIPGVNTSDMVLSLADSGFSEDAIYRTLNYLKDDINMKTPDEMKKFAEEDDINMFITHVCNLHETDPEIPETDVILLAEQMVNYDLDDYDNTIAEYYEDQEEEEDEDDY